MRKLSQGWFHSLLTVLVFCLAATFGRAQTPDDIVRQASRQLALQAVGRYNLLCQEKEAITSFKDGVMTSQRSYEAVVVSARLQNGNLDSQSSYRELLSIDGKRLSDTRRVFNIPMDVGVTHSQNIFGPGYPILRFTLDPHLAPAQPAQWIVEFQKKELMKDPSGYRVPDFGKVWIEKESHRLIRAEIHDELPATKFLNGPESFFDVERTVLENFNMVDIDGAPQWLVKTRTTHLVDKSNRNLTYTSVVEYHDCKRFTTTVTIKPLP